MANEFIENKELYKEEDIRREKVRSLKANGINPYAEKWNVTADIQKVRKMEIGQTVSTAGRIIFKRVMGKLAFIHIQDVFDKIQVSIGRNEISEEDFAFFKNNIDNGDFIGVEGELYNTHTGELTIRTIKFKLLSKAIKPLPDKFHGLNDTDLRYRQRYLDLVANEKSRQVLLGRSKMIAFIRKYLQENDFIEVETPIIQGAVCGASAKPFMTKHNALDKDCNLRIAPETYLKQVVAGGFNRVFEVAKCFRNEGMDSQHLQEFTQVEWYASYWNFEDNIKFFTKFFREILIHLTGKAEINKDGKTFVIGEEFERMDYTKAVNDCLGFNVLDYETAEELKAKVKELKMFPENEINQCISLGAVIDYIYKRKIRPNLIEPVILYNYPASLVPLARRSDDNPKTIEMFQLLIDGVEMCKCYSELVDPIIQRETLEQQASDKAKGDEEAMDVDEDFLLAMEHGMPPISGLGMGLDRLLMMIYDVDSIRDVVLFPIMK
ncbi:MAG: lysine--tRNA ligase [Clostridia bacterium]|nr:lysine--tRNA ligase [Clostridia bacterium]